MKSFIILVLLIIFAVSYAQAKDVIYQHPSDIANVKMPQYNNVSCKFSQTKSIPNSEAYIRSGGNFKFNINNGVVFETTYPVKSTIAYTTDQSRRISAIITAISKKDYSYINKNFDVYYLKKTNQWQLALKPKKDSKSHGVIDAIVIYGNYYIDTLEINTFKSGNTKINFTECR